MSRMNIFHTSKLLFRFSLLTAGATNYVHKLQALPLSALEERGDKEAKRRCDAHPASTSVIDPVASGNA